MLKKRFSRMLKEQDGVSFVIFVLALPFVLGFMALAIDISYAYFTRAKLQTIASSSALAAASQLDPDVPIDDRKDNARDEANLYADTKNPGLGHAAEKSDTDTTNHGVVNHITVDEDIIFGHWDDDRDPEFLPDTDDAFDPDVNPYNAVKVFARRDGVDTLPLFLGMTLPATDVNTYAIATAFGGVDQEICLLALDETDDEAIYVNGNNDINADKCGICSNGGITGKGGGQGTDGVTVTDGEIIYNVDGPGLNNEKQVEGVYDPFPRPDKLCQNPFENVDPFPDHWGHPCIPHSALADSNYDPTKTFGDDLVEGDPSAGQYLFPFSQEASGSGGINLIINPTPGYKLCGNMRSNNNDFKIGTPGAEETIFGGDTIDAVVFADGLHHFGSSDGAGSSNVQNFDLNGGGSNVIPIVGNNVTFLTTNVQLDWVGGSNTSLSAPSDMLGSGFIPGAEGTLGSPDLEAGVGHLLHQNPTVPGPGDDYVLNHELGGNSGSTLSGLIYTGLYSHFKFHGNLNVGTTNVCLSAIAGSFEWDGNTEMNLSSDCAASVPLAQSDLIVRLQE